MLPPPRPVIRPPRPVITQKADLTLFNHTIGSRLFLIFPPPLSILADSPCLRRRAITEPQPSSQTSPEPCPSSSRPRPRHRCRSAVLALVTRTELPCPRPQPAPSHRACARDPHRAAAPVPANLARVPPPQPHKPVYLAPHRFLSLPRTPIAEVLPCHHRKP
jgi:hypothetical protein